MSFVAVSKVKFPKALREEFHSLGMRMLPMAKEQPGFVSVRFHQSTDTAETMMYWEWDSQSDHETCMKSPDWNELMAASGELFQAEGVEFSVSTYERLA